MGTKSTFENASRLNAYSFDPDDLVIIDDRRSPLYDPGAHDELRPEFVANVARLGVIEPVVIRKGPDGEPIVVAGRKRVRAAREVNKERTNGDRIMVPCIVRRGDAASAYSATIAENVHRAPPDGRRETIAKAQRMANLGHVEGDIALDLGVSVKTVKRLLNADPKPPAKKKRGKSTAPGLTLVRACSSRVEKADLSPDARSILQWAAGELPTEELKKEIPGLFE